MNPLFFIAKRFIAGRTLDEALPAVEALNKAGFSTTLDFLGESVTDAKETTAVVDEYIRMLDLLAKRGLSRNVSLKLTQLGLDVDETLCFDNVAKILIAAGRLDAFVRVDMEGSPYTQKTIDMVLRWHRIYPYLGTVVQSMLRRTNKDITVLLNELIPIRLVKGAYKEPADVAFQSIKEIEQAFRHDSYRLLKSDLYHGIATHDEAIIEHIKQWAEKEGIRKDQFEFQLLYGIRRNLQKRLLSEGYHVRIYVPYGHAWLPYVSRRLRERKENVWFVVKNLFRR